MIRSLAIAKTGLDAQQTQLDVISNNLANVSTTGYKKSKAEFQDLLYSTSVAAGLGLASFGRICPMSGVAVATWPALRLPVSRSRLPCPLPSFPQVTANAAQSFYSVAHYLSLGRHWYRPCPPCGGLT